eukprot:7036016-Ditylum_brightwellii.AAC.1
MKIEEEDQTLIDRFWGIPTEAERKRWVEGARRRAYELLIQDKCAMMAAVGEIQLDSRELGDIAVGDNAEDEGGRENL